MTTVLITGFGRFPGAPSNPSGPLALAVAQSVFPLLAGARRVGHIFETSYASVDRELPQLMTRHRPDVVLMFGLAARTRYLRIEQRARNARSVLFPDVTGFRPRSRAIAVNHPSILEGRAPVDQLVVAARRAGVRARLSHNAGNYLCNYAYWRALEASRFGTPLVQFVHIPPVARFGWRWRLRLRPTLGELTCAGEAILLALLNARRRLG
jgi:pyroglutamyl-peptidase